MEIDVLSGNTLKLTLDKRDMNDMGLRYETLGAAEQTGWLLRQVLSDVQQCASELSRESRINFMQSRLFVEAFPRADGGCMMYISGLDKQDTTPASVPASVYSPKAAVTAKPASASKNLIALQTETPGDAEAALLALTKQLPEIPHTQLYRLGQGCVLAVPFAEQFSGTAETLLREYGSLKTGAEARLTLAHAREHSGEHAGE